MKRDWNVIREILNRLEALESSQATVDPDTFIGYVPEVVSYQISLLIEAGLIEGNCSERLNAPIHCWATRLTWEGHEFLDGIRSDTAWNRVKAVLKEKGIDLSFDSIKAAAGYVATQLLGGGA